jgi:spermidine/putrescine transport system substrate-binding protein
MKNFLAALLLAATLQSQAATPKPPLVVVSYLRMLSPEVCAAFEKQTGIPIQWESPKNQFEAYRRFAGKGNFDVSLLSADWNQSMLRTGGLAALNKLLLPNIRNVDPGWLGATPDPGNKFILPQRASVLGILLNKKIPQPPAPTVESLLGNPRPGGTACFVPATTLTGAVLLALGASPGDGFPDTLRASRPIWVNWLSNMSPDSLASESDPISGIPALSSSFLAGRQAAALLWSGDAALIIRAAPNRFKWTTPPDDALPLAIAAGISASSRRTADAHAFINFLFDPETVRMLVDHYPAMHTLKPSIVPQPLPEGMPTAELIKAAKETAPTMDLTRPRIDRLESFLDALPAPGSNVKK